MQPGRRPDAVAAVLALDVPVTFVPLDATSDVPVPADIADQLAPDHAAAGADIAYEMYARNPFLSSPGNDYWDTLTAVLLRDPTLATWEDVTVRTETSGASAGRLVRDPDGRSVRAAIGSRPVTRSCARSWSRCARVHHVPSRSRLPAASPWSSTGRPAGSWVEPTSSAGLTTVELRNLGPVTVFLMVGGAVPPKTWADVVAWLSAADLSDPDLAIPAWAIQVGRLHGERGRDDDDDGDAP